MKHILGIIFLCIGFSFSGFSQMAAEPQPFPLRDYQITFYETHMNVASVEVTLMDGGEIEGNQPKIILDEASNSYTIDFTDCTEGQYLISGKRDDLEIEYSVER